MQIAEAGCSAANTGHGRAHSWVWLALGTHLSIALSSWRAKGSAIKSETRRYVAEEAAAIGGGSVAMREGGKPKPCVPQCTVQPQYLTA